MFYKRISQKRFQFTVALGGRQGQVSTGILKLKQVRCREMKGVGKVHIAPQRQHL